MTKTVSRSKTLCDEFRQNLNAYENGPVSGQERKVIWGVTDKGVFVDGLTMDGFLAKGRIILRDSKRIYRYGNTLVFERARGADRHLVLLATDSKADAGAQAALNSLMVVGVRTKDSTKQSLVPGKLVSALLADEAL